MPLQVAWTVCVTHLFFHIHLFSVTIFGRSYFLLCSRKEVPAGYFVFVFLLVCVIVCCICASAAQISFFFFHFFCICILLCFIATMYMYGKKTLIQMILPGRLILKLQQNLLTHQFFKNLPSWRGRLFVFSEAQNRICSKPAATPTSAVAPVQACCFKSTFKIFTEF